MFDRLVSGNGFSSLERALQFASARQRIIANNIANLETPGFRPVDVSVEGFQEALKSAIDERQRGVELGVSDSSQGEPLTAPDGGLALPHSDEFRVTDEGLELAPTPIGDGIMFHDGNDRSLERILQSLTENLMQFRFASLLIRRHFQSLDQAIRERL